MNRYRKALKHIKSKKLDEKIQRLKEEMPTNNTTKVYDMNPSGYRLGPKSKPKLYYPGPDGTWPDGIPGTEGEDSYIRPYGYWDGEVDWEQSYTAEVGQVLLGDDGKSTQGLIADNGTVKVPLPDGGRSFILGPLVDGWVLNHTNDAYTNIGYIQKDTRQFVLLGRVEGQWKAGMHNGSAPVWDGTSSGFTAYNENFTLAMAQWFRTQVLNTNYVDDIPYWYSGGVPQGDVTCPTCPSGMKGGMLAGSDGGLSGTGAGNVDTVNIGTQHTQGASQAGDAGDLDLWGLTFGALKKELDSVFKFLTDKDVAAKEISDLLLKDLPQAIGTKKGFVLGVATSLGSLIAAHTTGRTSSEEEFLRGGLKPVMGTVNNQTEYGGNLAASLLRSMTTGKSVVMDDNNMSRSMKKQLAQSLTVNDIKNILNRSGVGDGSPPSLSMNADSVLNPGSDKQVYRNGGAGGEGGSIIKIYLNKNGEIKLRETSDKVTRISGEAGGGFDRKTMSFKDIPTPSDSTLKSMVDKVLDSGGLEHIGAASMKVQNMLRDVEIKTPVDAKGTGFKPFDHTGGQKISYEDALQQSKDIVKSDEFNKFVKNVVTNPIVSKGLTSMGTGSVNGHVMGALVTAKIAETLGLKPKSELEEAGASGHVRSQRDLSGNDLGQEQQQLIRDYLDKKGKAYTKSKVQKESYLSEERSIEILREIKKPYKMPEIPKQKYKMNFSGKFSSQNTPDKTASKATDALVASGIDRGHRWRTQDRYWQGYETTERMNVVYDKLGHADQAWNMITEKNGWKDREMQEHLNMMAHDKQMFKENPLYESPFYTKNEPQPYEKDPLYKKVKDTLNKELHYKDKPSVKGYPNDPPPEMVNGWHPKFGKRYKHDKLDPQSAEAMPPTGDPEIDANIDKATDQKAKARKTKVLAGKTEQFSNWRDELTDA